MKKIYTFIAMLTFICISCSFAGTQRNKTNLPLTNLSLQLNDESLSKVLSVDFGASDTLTCNGIIQFTDLSSNGANGWIWHFGDGGASYVQNPTHTYTSGGYFTVTLTTVGVAGIDSLVKTNYIHVAFLTSPSVSNDTTICAYNPVTLTASGSGQIAWFNAISGGTQLDTGASYTSVPLTATTTFYAASQQSQPSFYGGPADSSLGGGSYNNPGMNRYTTFDCNISCRLVSVLVYATGAGNRTITLADNAGNNIQSLTVNIPDGESRVYLNFDIQPGSGYRLGTGGNANLYRNNAGAVYPYDINGTISLTGNNGGGADFYYYFYDWEVSSPPCVSARIPITVTVSPGPQASFNYSQYLNTFTCTNSTTGATSWSWDFGDGSAPVLTQNANHTYAGAGTYVITLTASNGSCSSTISVTVNSTVFNFAANDTVTCTGIVQFTDLANNGATAWIWKFGDGATSTLQNPSHTYTSGGFFNVTFTTVGINGIDSLVKTNYINVALLSAPTVSNDTTICQYNPVTLTAFGSAGTIAWFDSSAAGNQLDTGAVFTSGPLTASTTFYAASQQVGTSFYGGATDSSLGGGGIYTQNNDLALVFDCNMSCRIVSVKVYAQGAGIRTIYLNDGNGIQLNSISVNIPDGESRVNLNFDVQLGTNYELTCAAPPGLYRNNTGANYPYDINGMISITGNTAGGGAANYYYFFYDWEVSTPPCVSPRVPVNVTVTPGPQASFIFNQNLNSFTCTDLSVGATTWSWDFGDGSAPVNTQNATHAYTTSGTYVITLIAGNGTCSSSQSVTVNATFAGIDELNGAQVSLQPNPVKDILKINIQDNVTNAKLTFINSLGQVVYTSSNKEFKNGSASINLTTLVSGIYTLKIESNESIMVKKIIKD